MCVQYNLQNISVKLDASQYENELRRYKTDSLLTIYIIWKVTWKISSERKEILFS